MLAWKDGMRAMVISAQANLFQSALQSIFRASSSGVAGSVTTMTGCNNREDDPLTKVNPAGAEESFSGSLVDPDPLTG